MKYLLDTHTFLWTVFEPEKIGVKAKALITNREHAILVSLVSFWEISLKYSLGKLHLENVSPAEFPAIAKTNTMASPSTNQTFLPFIRPSLLNN